MNFKCSCNFRTKNKSTNEFHMNSFDKHQNVSTTHLHAIYSFNRVVAFLISGDKDTNLYTGECYLLFFYVNFLPRILFIAFLETSWYVFSRYAPFVCMCVCVRRLGTFQSTRIYYDLTSGSFVLRILLKWRRFICTNLVFFFFGKFLACICTLMTL